VKDKVRQIVEAEHLFAALIAHDLPIRLILMGVILDKTVLKEFEII